MDSRFRGNDDASEGSAQQMTPVLEFISLPVCESVCLQCVSFGLLRSGSESRLKRTIENG